MTKTKTILLLFFIIGFRNTVNCQDSLPEISVTKITENVIKLFVYDYVNLFAVTGPESTILIDTGFDETKEQLELKLRELGLDNIKYIVNTHSDGDHTGGNNYFGEGNIMIAHPVCRNKLAGRKDITKEGVPSVSLDDSLTIYSNSEEIKLYALAGSHSPEDVLVYIPESKVVLLGDIILSDSFPVVRIGQGASIKTLIKNLEQIIDMFPNDVTLCPSHGREYTMDELRAYHTMIVETFRIVSEQFNRGISLEKLIEKDFLGDWKKWDNKKFLHVNRDFWIKTIYGELQS